ncbi:MAG: hypothetical protein VX016_04305, partial [Verrucomicrobiota bacterium]|nr:hypothetical protein [Verrucomicrobiota bacterium]
NMKKLFLIPVLLFTSFLTVSNASFGEMLEENGIDWIIGSWKMERDGNTMELSYKWAIDGQVISTHLKMANNESFGVIGINPKNGKVEQSGFNNKGEKVTGEWMPWGDLPLVKIKVDRESGDPSHMAVAFRKVDDETIELQIIPVDDSGTIASSPEYTFEMKKS